jgi:hypothetical protein
VAQTSLARELMKDYSQQRRATSINAKLKADGKQRGGR